MAAIEDTRSDKYPSYIMLNTGEISAIKAPKIKSKKQS